LSSSRSFQHVESRISGTTGHCLDVPGEVLPGRCLGISG
jgi:hypothetical protein